MKNKIPSYYNDIYLISDCHFGHANIINYCNRPFNSVYEMNEALISNWKKKVPKSAFVYNLGDFCFRGDRHEMIRILWRVHGQKQFLIKGNHDTKSDHFYREIGFDKVYDKPIIFDQHLILSHQPLPYDLTDTSFINVFGHTHNDQEYPTYTPNSACVCVERHDYAPVCLAEVMENIYRMREQNG